MNEAFRPAAFYALVFACTGVSLPFISLWFAAKGMSGVEISIALAAPMLARIVTGPAAAVWGDGYRLRRTPLAILTGVACVSFALMGLTEGAVAWLPLWFVGATCMAVTVPLSDVLTMRRAQARGFPYSVVRSVGSISFIAVNLAMGVLLTLVRIDAVIIWIAVAAGCASLAALLVLPDEPTDEAGVQRFTDRFRGVGALLGDRVFMTAIGAVGLIQAAHGFNYGFGSLVWRAQGFSEATIGFLWALGVAAEVAFMWLVWPRRRWNAWSTLALAGGVAALRWLIMAFEPPLWVLIPLQLLHAFTFAAGFLAGLQLVQQLAPKRSLSAGQTLSSALSSGVLLGLATIVSGPLFDRYGAEGYAAMAVLAVAGLGLALSLKGEARIRLADQPQSTGEGGSIIEP